MKKILIALVLLVIAVVAAGPYLIGSQIEKITEQLVSKGNQQLSTVVASNPQVQSGSLTVDDYQKGYLNSQAKGVLTVAMADAGESRTFAIPFNAEIKHGPYLGGAGFGLARIISKPDLSGLDLPESINADTLVIESVVDFTQGLTDTVTVAPIKHVSEDGNTVDFAGAVINSKSSVKNRSTFTADMRVKQLILSSTDESNVLTLKPFDVEMSGEGDGQQAGTYEMGSGIIEASMGSGVSIVLQKMAATGNYKQATGADFTLGNGGLTITDLVVTNPESLATPLKLPELIFNTKLEQAQNEDLTMSMQYRGKLDPSMMELMRSPVDIKTAAIDLEFKAIPLTVVTEYQKLVSDMMAEADQEKMAQAMQAKFLELVQMLASNAASTHLNLVANSDDGDLVADIDTGFKPGVNFDAAQMMQLIVSPDPGTIMPLLVGRGNVSLGKGVTDKAGLTPMIQIMAAEYVTLKDDKFVAELQITDGQLLINGTPLPLAPQ